MKVCTYVDVYPLTILVVLKQSHSSFIHVHCCFREIFEHLVLGNGDVLPLFMLRDMNCFLGLLRGCHDDESITTRGANFE
jgi:hypothetical protein